MLALALAASLLAAAPPRIIVLDVATEEKGIKPSSLAALTELTTLELTRYAEGGRLFDVLSGRELRDALKLEGERQSIGCDKTSCAGEIAQAFGARYVVFLVLSRLGGEMTLTLSMFDSEEARVVGRAADQARTVADLAGGLPDAVRTLASSIVKVGAVPQSHARTRRGARGPAAGAGQARAVVYPELSDDEVPLVDEPLTEEDAAVCGYDDREDRWSCGGKDGVVTVELRRAGSASTHAVARFRPHVKDRCLDAVDVELQSGDETVTVDWRDAVFVVDGVAVPARPARSYERPVSAPAGVVAAERIVPRSAACVGGTSLDGKERETASLTLGYLVGATPARAKFLRVKARGTVPEDALLAHARPPEDPVPPADLVDPDTSRFSWGLAGGLGVGAAIGGLTGLFVGGVWMPRSATLADRASVGGGYGGICAVCAGLPLGIGGLVYDGAQDAALENEKRATANYRREKKRVAAWRRFVAGQDARARH